MEQAHPVQRFVVIEALAGVFVMGVVGADADARIVGIAWVVSWRWGGRAVKV